MCIRDRLWIARILGIFYAILLFLFSLSHIKDGVGFWDNLASLGLNLLPFLFIIGVLALAWKRTLITGVGFLIVSIAYLVFYRDISLVNMLIVLGPGMLNGLLFVVIHFIKPAQEKTLSSTGSPLKK